MPELPNLALSRAVLIGTSKFAHLPDLPAVHNNLVDLHGALTDVEHGILAAENCEIVDDPQAPHSFMSHLRRIAARTDDLLLVYYAGHGIRHDTRDTLYLTTGRTDPDALNESAVPFEWVKEVLENSPARTRLLVLDCCYSGMALGAMSGGVDSREMEVRGSAVMASSPKNKKSHSPVGHRNTAFTEKMVALLRDGSPNPTEQLTVATLYKRIYSALARENQAKPLLKVTDTSGDLLVRNFAELPRPQTTPPRVTPPPSDPPTVPTLRSQVSPLPVTVAVPAIASPQFDQARLTVPGRAGTHVRRRSLYVLGVLTGLCLALTIGGLVGVITGEEPTESTTGGPGADLAAGLPLTVIFGTALIATRYRWRHLVRESPSRSTRWQVVMTLVLLFLIAMIIFGPFTPAWREGPLSTVIGAEVVLSEGAGVCIYLLARRPREVRHRA